MIKIFTDEMCDFLLPGIKMLSPGRANMHMRGLFKAIEKVELQIRADPTKIDRLTQSEKEILVEFVRLKGE